MGLSLLLVMFFVRTFALEPFQIPAKSMYPALEPGDFVVVNKLGYGNYKFFGFSVLQTPLFATVKRGDILVFEYPRNPDLSYIKRVIGLPGDKIKAVEGTYYINGELLQTEQKSVDSNFTYLTETNENLSYTIAHRNDIDKRLSFNATVAPDSYFVLGDNRLNSNDSRYWGVVPEENLIGKLLYVHSATDSGH